MKTTTRIENLFTLIQRGELKLEVGTMKYSTYKLEVTEVQCTDVTSTPGWNVVVWYRGDIIGGMNFDQQFNGWHLEFKYPQPSLSGNK